MIGPTSLAITLGVAILVFGPRNLPTLARDAGKALGEFRRAISGSANETLQ